MTAEQHVIYGRTTEQIFKDGLAYLYKAFSSDMRRKSYLTDN